MKVNLYIVLIAILSISTVTFAVLWMGQLQDRGKVLEDDRAGSDLYYEKDIEDAVLSTEQPITTEQPVTTVVIDEEVEDVILEGDAIFVDSLMFDYGDILEEGFTTCGGMIHIINEQGIGIEGTLVSLKIRTYDTEGNMFEEDKVVVTDDFGRVKFDVTVGVGTGNWSVEVIDITGEGLRYAPELNNIRVYSGINQ